MSIEVAAIHATLGMIDNLTPGLKNANNSLSSFASDLGSQMTNFGKSLTAGLTVPIVGALGFAVKAASDNATTMAKLNQQIRDTGNATGVTVPMITNLADSLEKMSGVSKNSILQAETLTASYKQIGKDIFPAATKAALDMSAALNIDLRTATISLDKALADPIKGLTALRREGVVFTQQQQDQIKAMEKSGNLLGAQNIILGAVTQKYQGMAAAIGNTPQGNLNKLTNAITDLGVAIGNTLAPVLGPIVKNVTDFVNGLTKLPQPVLELAVKIALLAAAAGPLLIVVGSLTTAFGALAGVFFPVIAPLLLIGGLIAAYTTNWMGFRDTVDKIGVSLRNLGPAGATALLVLVPIGFQLAKLAVAGFLEGIATGFDVIFGSVTALAGSLAVLAVPLGIIYAYFTDPKFAAGINAAGDAFKNNFTAGIQGFQDIVGGHPTQAGVNALGNLGMQAANPVGAIINLALNAIGIRDSGGPGQAGQPVMIGKGAQPELFVPSTAGNFYPAGSYGGGPDTLHVILQAQNFEEHLYYNIAEASRSASRSR